LARSEVLEGSVSKPTAESEGRVSGRLGAAAKFGIPSSTLESKIKSTKIKKYLFKIAEAAILSCFRN
jgi:hypothetical protein